MLEMAASKVSLVLLRVEMLAFCSTVATCLMTVCLALVCCIVVRLGSKLDSACLWVAVRWTGLWMIGYELLTVSSIA